MCLKSQLIFLMIWPTTVHSVHLSVTAALQHVCILLHVSVKMSYIYIHLWSMLITIYTLSLYYRHIIQILYWNLPVIVGWLGHHFGWNATHYFSFKLTYTISRTQQSFHKCTAVTKHLKSPKYVSQSANTKIVPRMESSY